MSAQPRERVWSEELKVSGRAVVNTVKDLLHEGNVRRITIKNSKGDAVISIPVTVGVIGVLVAPTVAAVVALGADYTLVVERREEEPPSEIEREVRVDEG
jgi:DNA-binding Lrp family transcriptional regulator